MRAAPGGGEDRVVGPLQRVAQAGRIVEHQVRVVPGVIPDRVAVVHFLAHDVRVSRNGPADDEKRGVDVLLAEHVEYAVGVRRVRPVVVGQRDHALVAGTANEGFSEKLVARTLEHFVGAEDQRCEDDGRNRDPNRKRPRLA